MGDNMPLVERRWNCLDSFHEVFYKYRQYDESTNNIQVGLLLNFVDTGLKLRFSERIIDLDGD